MPNNLVFTILWVAVVFFSQAKISRMLTVNVCAADKPPIGGKMHLMQTEIHSEPETQREKWEKSITCLELCLQRYDDDLCKQAQDL